MKNFINLFSVLAVCGLFLLTSCNDESSNINNQEQQLSEEQLFKQSISLFDARIHSLNQEEYVRELVFVSFSDDAQMPAIVAFDGVAFSDNGEQMDRVAGDGIYTSVEKFKHDVRIPFLADQMLRSVMENPIVDPTFKHSKALADYSAAYTLRANEVQSRILEVTCPIEFGTKGCLAQRWGWCDSCCVTVYTNNCTVTVGF